MSDNLPAIAGDVHYEVALDPEPERAAPAVVDLQPGQVALLPVIPDHLATVAGVKAALARQAALHGHKGRYHGVRLPKYAGLTVVYAVAGVFRLLWRLLHWWWVLEQQSLESEAVVRGDDKGYRALKKDAREDRRGRGIGLLSGLAAAGLAVYALYAYGQWWADLLVAAGVVMFLARLGRPKDKPIIAPAVVTARFRRLSADVVLRAYYAAGLGHPDKPDQQVTFGSPMSRDGEGSRVLVDLPYGKGLDDAVKAKPAIASGLDVTESQVFLHRDPTSHRRHTLWVADRDPLAVPVGRTPLLACKQTDIWKPAPLGLDERGQLVTLPLMWNSVLVGALPRQGKTFTARLLGLYAALDPYVKLDVFDFKGSPDWRKFALVADRCAFGLTVSRAGDPLQIFGETLSGIKADVQDRYHQLSELDPKICPEGKLTRAIARDPRFGMPIRVVILEEFQEVYDLPGDASKAVAAELAFLVKVAPGAGVILIASTQKPSGIGSGTAVATQFNSFRDNFAVRFSLRTSSYHVSDAVLGAGAYSEGLDSSTLLPQYKGVGILRGATDASPTVRTFLADGQDAEKVLTAARAIRERAGTLSGFALGEAPPAPVSILADVLAVMGDQPGLHWDTLSGLLRARFPERRGECTPESVRSECGDAGVPNKQVKHLGRNTSGCYREHVMQAMQQRDGL